MGATHWDFTATPRDYPWIGTEDDSRNLLIVDEQRYIDFGISDKCDVLVVANTERSSNIHIVSCRKATSSEGKFYEEDNGYNRTSGPTPIPSTKGSIHQTPLRPCCDSKR